MKDRYYIERYPSLLSVPVVIESTWGASRWDDVTSRIQIGDRKFAINTWGRRGVSITETGNDDCPRLTPSEAREMRAWVQMTRRIGDMRGNIADSAWGPEDDTYLAEWMSDHEFAFA